MVKAAREAQGGVQQHCPVVLHHLACPINTPAAPYGALGLHPPWVLLYRNKHFQGKGISKDKLPASPEIILFHASRKAMWASRGED